MGEFPSVRVVCAALVLPWVLLFVVVRLRRRSKKIVGFFHPYSNAGGGGERVLWCAVQAVQELDSSLSCVIYTGNEGIAPESIVQRAKERFGVSLPRDVEFVFLSSRKLVEATSYPRLTMIGQSIGSMLLGIEALLRLNPAILIDTMGYSFTYPVFSILGGSRVACYVHYPTISTDMLNMVYERRTLYNNDGAVAQNFLLSRVKYMYYLIFATVYGWMGSFSEVVMVNSSWTKGHIASLWRIDPAVVYPPCDTATMQDLPLKFEGEGAREAGTIVSIGQFRPEKDHHLQINAFAKVVEDPAVKDAHLVIIGSTRGTEDEARVAALRQEVARLGLENSVSILTNVPYPELVSWLARASVGLHTMWNEHFGIAVVELMAAGLVAVAHKSGGPLADIVEDGVTGFLAKDTDEYAAKLQRVLTHASVRQEIAVAGRLSVDRFSEAVFNKNFKAAIRPILSH